MPRHIKYLGYQPPKTCNGKVCYRHKHEAETAAEENMIMQPDLKLHVYRCLYCHNWHLTRTRGAIENN